MTPGVFTTGGLRLSPGSFWNFSFPTGNPTVSSAHESGNRLEPVFREAGSGEHPACVESKDQGSLTAFLHTGHTVGIPVGPAACPAPGHHKAPPPPPICRQQLFLTGVPLSTADGDQNGPVGRQHMVPPPAHAHALTDTQIGLFEVPCLWLQMQPGSSRNPIGFWDPPLPRSANLSLGPFSI